MVEIEIIEGRHQPLGEKGQQGDSMFWTQEAYAHLGGAFPVCFRMRLRDPMQARPVGLYQIGGGAYEVGRYMRLELNGFRLVENLVPVARKPQVKGVA